MIVCASQVTLFKSSLNYNNGSRRFFFNSQWSTSLYYCLTVLWATALVQSVHGCCDALFQFNWIFMCILYFVRIDGKLRSMCDFLEHWTKLWVIAFFCYLNFGAKFYVVYRMIDCGWKNKLRTRCQNVFFFNLTNKYIMNILCRFQTCFVNKFKYTKW